jgi:hypothetical protein
MHKNKTAQKWWGVELQLALQMKTYKLQTNSLNKHYSQKCKTRSKQTKGRGVGKSCSPLEAMARSMELIDTLHLMLVFTLQQFEQENA